MPKINLKINPGEELKEPLNRFLEKYFNEKELTKLFKLGGRIQVSIAAPYTDPVNRKDKLQINESYLKKLSSSNDLDKELDGLTIKQLKRISMLLALPISAKENSQNIREIIKRSINDPIIWGKIANNSK